DETVALWETYDVEHVTRSGYIAGALDEHRAIHPLIRRHPESGRPLVYASPGYARRVCGLDDAMSARVLARVSEIIEPLQTSHRWEPADLIVWDNRAAAHRATSHDPSETRLLWRVLVSTSPVAAA
ncbi:MAG: TauD/TfdA dioxygenase family protein, partial [Vicinamibacterales bacterium]